MKPLYLFCDNHMDVIWRRGCRHLLRAVDGVIRPYSDLEEEQIRRAVRQCGKGEYRYTFEQSLPLKLFLERNPDTLPVVRKLVDEGRLELPGGGETLVDLNMVSGESLVRNHLYSIRWCERTFGTRSATAVGTDLFGYSAQVPQILRQLGYETLANSSRFFDDNIPFWRGLDGSTVLVRPSWENLGLPQVFAGGGCVRAPSACCDGDGCPVCGYRGMDLSDENVRSDEHLARLFERIAGIDGGPIVLRITGEETLENDAALERLVALAREAGFEPRFLTMTELVELCDGERLARLRAGDVAEADLYPGVEANPNCTGCYVSRIRLKQWNRKLENLLQAGETFAAFAADFGLLYPRAKIERLWTQMALLQFHDAITGSHSDGAYEELIDLCRDIARGAHQVYEEAGQTIATRIAVPPRDGYRAAAVFNPLPWPVDGAPVDIVLDVPRGETALDAEVIDGAGQPLAVSGARSVANAIGGKLALRLTGLRLPANGYATVHYRLRENASVPPALGGNALENEHYRITFGAGGVASIVDKDIDQVILGENAGGLLFEEDYGSPWETLIPPAFSCWVARHSSPTITLSGDADRVTAVVEGRFADARIQRDRLIARLDWRQELTLYAGLKRIYLRTTIDWDTTHGRVMLGFPLSFRTPDDEAVYEIPFGTLTRRRYPGEYGEHTRPNGDWPALNFVACHNAAQGYWVSFFNHGTPCHRVADGTVRMTVLRSPFVPMAAQDAQGARDVGKHVFEAMIASGAGDLRDLNPVRLGREFNAPFLAMPLGGSPAADLPAERSFLSHDNPAVTISAIKRAEEGEDLVIRLYEPYGAAARTTLSGVDGLLTRTDLLERPVDEGEALVLGANEIQTVKTSHGR